MDEDNEIIRRLRYPLNKNHILVDDMLFSCSSDMYANIRAHVQKNALVKVDLHRDSTVKAVILVSALSDNRYVYATDI